MQNSDSRSLLEKDIEKLKFVKKSIERGDACTYDKPTCLGYLDSVITPRCCVCRKPIDGDMIVIRERKMHPTCSKKYRI